MENQIIIKHPVITGILVLVFSNGKKHDGFINWNKNVQYEILNFRSRLQIWYFSRRVLAMVRILLVV